MKRAKKQDIEELRAGILNLRRVLETPPTGISIRAVRWGKRKILFSIKGENVDFAKAFENLGKGLTGDSDENKET